MLSNLTIIAIIIIFSYYLFIDFPELIAGIDKWYKLLCDLSLGVLINFVFFLFLIYLPGIQEEKKAFLMIKPRLEIVLRDMQELILVMRHYFPEIESAKLQVLEQRIYYKLVPITSVDGLGWAREFDFYTSITNIKRSINCQIKRIASNIYFSQGNKELIESISNFQVNDFLKHIEIAQNCKYNSTFTFSDIPKSFSDFCYIFERLKELGVECQEKRLVILNDVEKQKFLDCLNSIPEQDFNIYTPHVYL